MGQNTLLLFLGRNSYGVTDVDTYWFGQFQIREENKWNNSQTYVYGSTIRKTGRLWYGLSLGKIELFKTEKNLSFQ